MKPYVCLIAVMFCPAPVGAQPLGCPARIPDRGPWLAIRETETEVRPSPRRSRGIQGIAADRAGNLYLSDTDNHRVRRVSPAA